MRTGTHASRAAPCDDGYRLQTTVDSLIDGAVVLEQPAPGQGYRFNADSVLLADFAMRGRQVVTHLVDLGAGVGAVALCAARNGRVQRVTMVDCEPVACELARRNAERAGLSDAACVIECGVEQLEASALGPVDVVVMNPPYTADGAGRASPVRGRDRARRGSLEPFVDAASRLLTDNGGRAFVCQPAGSLVHLLRSIESAGLCARAGAFVFPSKQRPARIVLLEFGRESGPFSLEPDRFG
jgi:tRNA1(Val) A37 N6-methylase TrmN6